MFKIAVGRMIKYTHMRFLSIMASYFLSKYFVRIVENEVK